MPAPLPLCHAHCPCEKCKVMRRQSWALYELAGLLRQVSDRIHTGAIANHSSASERARAKLETEINSALAKAERSGVIEPAKVKP